jgi:hypothetical protein
MELAPIVKTQFFDLNGNPLSGGKLYVYEAGTSTPKATYTSRDGLSANSFPITLDSRGECDLWLTSGYHKFVLKDSDGNTIWTKDQISLASESALASAFYRGVVYLTSANSPYTMSQSDNGYLINCDTSGGAIVVNLPQLSSVVLPFNACVKKTTSDVNTVTINRQGTDTIDGLTSKTLATANAAAQFVGSIAKSPDDWSSIDQGTVGDLSIVTAKLGPAAVTRDKMATGAVANLLVTPKTYFVTGYTASTSDDVYTCSTAGGSWIFTLPAAASCSGKVFKFIKTTNDANILTIDGNGTELIGFAQTMKLVDQNSVLHIYSNGTGWDILSYTQPVSARYYRATSNGTTGVAVPLDFQTKSYDPLSLVTTGTWKFTAPFNGFYKVDWLCDNSADGSAYLYKNGSQYSNLGNYRGTSFGAQNYTDGLNLVAGDYIDVRCSTGALLFTNNPYINITLIK